MTLVIPPGYAQAAWRFSLLGDPEVMVTTCGLDITGEPQAQANAFADLWLSEFPATNMAVGWTYLGAVLRVGQDGGPPAIFEAPRNVAGVGGGQSLPSNCALLVRKNTGVGGRAGRGRFYVPLTSVGEGSIDANGMIDAATVTALQLNWNDLFAGFAPVLLHDSASPVTTPTTVVSFTVQRQIATQRRRMRH